MIDKSRKIAIGSDHAGYELKEFLKTKLLTFGYSFEDFGTNSNESVDYPDVIHPLANAIDKGYFECAVIMCGSGNGVSMVANKYQNVRAALCWNEETARLARQHNNANIMALPARLIEREYACALLRIFLETNYEGGRHERRVQKIPRP